MEPNTFFSKPFEAMTEEELRAEIKAKFTNLARFCRLTKRDVYEFNKLFKLKDTEHHREELRRVYDEAKATDNGPAPNELTDEARRRIKAGIFNKCDNILEFCDAYGYYNTWISKLLHGHVRKITPKVRRLLKQIDVDIKPKSEAA